MKEYNMITTFYLSTYNTVEANSLYEAKEKAAKMAWDELSDDLDLLRLSITDFVAQTEEMA